MKTLLEGIIEGFVREYTDAQKQKIGIPLDVVSRGGKWYRGDKYAGRVVNGKFVSAEEEPEGQPTGGEDDPQAGQQSLAQGTADAEKFLGLGDTSTQSSQLDKLDTESRDAANESLGGPKKRKTIPNPISPEDIINILKPEDSKISPAYIDALVHIINTSSSTKGWLVSDFLKRSGAGQPASQAGEILTTLHLALSEEKSSALHQHLTERLTGRGNRNNKQSVVDASWLKAARNNSVAFRRYLDLRHGPGNWSVESVAWDVPDEVTAIGVDYSQTEPSTDTFVRVKTPNGSEIEQVSLKKDKKVNFLNLSTGQFEEYVVRAMSDAGEEKYSEFLDDAYADLEKCENIKMDSDNKTKNEQRKCRRDANRRIQELYDEAFEKLNIPQELSARGVARRQTEIHREGISKHSDTMKRMAAKIVGEGCPSKTLEEIDKAMGAGQKIAKDCKEYQKFFKSVVEHKGDLSLDTLQELGKNTKFGGDLAKAQKASIILSVIPDKKIKGSEQMHKDIYIMARDNAFGHSQALMDWSMNTEEGRSTVNRVIRERMPIQGVVEGKEAMLIGDVHFTKEDAIVLFGTDNFDEINERLVSVPGDDPPPPGPRIEYQIEGTDEKFTVAALGSRPDGIGYGGTWKFELSLDEEFESRLREVNQQRQVDTPQPQQEESISPREQQLRNELKKLVRDIAINRLGKYGN